MQDEDFQFMVRNASLTGYQMARQSFAEGGNLWRHLVKNGLYDGASAREIGHTFFAIIGCGDVDKAKECAKAVFSQPTCHDRGWLNNWFYGPAIVGESRIHSQIAGCADFGDARSPICPPTLSAVLGMLKDQGLDLNVHAPLKLEEGAYVRSNGLTELIDTATSATASKQKNMLAVARAYLDNGVTMYDSADGIGESPLAVLLRCDEVTCVAPWVTPLIEEGHVRHEHVRACAQLDDISPDAVALFDSYFARKQVQAIAAVAATAQATAHAVSP